MNCPDKRVRAVPASHRASTPCTSPKDLAGDEQNFAHQTRQILHQKTHLQMGDIRHLPGAIHNSILQVSSLQALTSAATSLHPPMNFRTQHIAISIWPCLLYRLPRPNNGHNSCFSVKTSQLSVATTHPYSMSSNDSSYRIFLLSNQNHKPYRNILLNVLDITLM